MPLQERMIDAFSVMIVGMGTVVLSLWVIGEVFAFLRWCFHSKANPQSAAPMVEAHPGDDPAELVALLTAAATAAVGKRVVVQRVKFIHPDTVVGWAEAGRTSIQTSHNLRRGL